MVVLSPELLLPVAPLVEVGVGEEVIRGVDVAVPADGVDAGSDFVVDGGAELESESDPEELLLFPLSDAGVVEAVASELLDLG